MKWKQGQIIIMHKVSHGLQVLKMEEEGHGPRYVWWLLEDERAKEWILSESIQKGHSPGNNLDVSSVRPISYSWPPEL